MAKRTKEEIEEAKWKEKLRVLRNGPDLDMYLASVDLSMNSLAAHTFITGSTGSGKSNTVCKIIEEVRKSGGKFLVIEPAKGEYKNLFGKDGQISVYGTNPKLMTAQQQ